VVTEASYQSLGPGTFHHWRWTNHRWNYSWMMAYAEFLVGLCSLS